jgi:methylated-DNA-[protein]-cysteine S-methyltransferase
MTKVATSRTHGYASTPLGRVLVVSSGGSLVGLYFDGHERTPSVPDHATGSSELLNSIGNQLDEYFRGARTRFDLPLRLEGTPFQIAVWSAVIDIPYGQTSAYGRVAERVGRPRAARAVGAANGQNPISIVVPCHRLVGANGALTGYGWGLDRKRSLLELEGADPALGIATAGPLSRSGR